MRKKLITGFAGTLLLSIFGYVLMNSYEFKLCFSDLNTNTYDVSCSILLNKIGEPLFYGMMALSTVFLLLTIIPSAFNPWKNFAIWFVPIATVIFATYKGPGGGFMDPTPYPEQVFQWISILYVVISLIIIGASIYKSRVK